MKTYSDVYIAVRNTLKALDIASPELEARILVSEVAGKSKSDFVRDSRLHVNDDFEEKVRTLLERRLEGEPLAYIIGSWEFYGLPLKITRDVLIPRVDTEVVAEAAIRLAEDFPDGARVLDLCCGSGCIGIAIAANVPGIQMVLSDMSENALKVSRLNAALNKLTPRIRCVKADAMSRPEPFFGSFDLIVCNPPYIPTGDISGLDLSVREFEPISALDGGADGLDFYRTITLDWKSILKDGGWLVYECGVNQSECVEFTLRTNGFEEIGTAKDTLGINRAVFGKYKTI